MLREQAPAKVNLCLFLGEARPEDGRHELVTLFESISLADEFELTETPGARADEVVCPGIDGPNLVSQALAALRAAGWNAPPVRIEISKRIPVAAGLGGGSADAAAALRLAHAVEPLPPGLAERLARELGADVPGQLNPGVSIGTGAGEKIEPREAMAPHALVIVPQPFGLSTVEVYREADRLGLPRDPVALEERLHAVRAAAIQGGRLPNALAMNDLGRAALSLAPQINDALSALRDAGAEQILVCGSGPTSAGLFWGEDAERRATAAVSSLPLPASAAIPSSASGTMEPPV